MIRLRIVCLIFSLTLNGCAVLSKDTTRWSTYSNPDSTHDLQLAYSVTGEGNPLLLIHGFGASSYSWRHMIKPLAEKFRVITIDLKGFGDSPKPRDNFYNVYDQARLIRNFILDQELTQLTLIGHSFGGGVALVTSVYLNTSHPNLQKGLILIDSIAYKQDLPDFVELLATPIIGPMITYLLPDKFQTRRLLEEVYYDKDSIPQTAIDHYAKTLDKNNAKYAILTGARQIIPDDLEQFSKRYREIDIPTLIIWSEDDELVPLSIGKRLHAELPNSNMVTLQKVGHAPHEEKPSLVLPHLMQFLETNNKKTKSLSE